MSLNPGYFPLRRRQTNNFFQYSANNQHRTTLLNSARSSIESTNGNETCLPSISASVVRNEGHRPYRRNDFANNHLFIAKRKLSGILLGQPTRNLQGTSELIHLFDQQGPRRKKHDFLRQKNQETASNKSTLTESDAHLSVVNLVIKPPHPFSSQTRDPLATILQRRQQIYSSKTPRSAIDTTTKPTFQSTSLHTFTDTTELDDTIEAENLSEMLNISNNPFDSSILCVKSIIPSAGPQPSNHYLLQHR